jgi:alkanesulfonate monooxygenase SsuD/methylene tetrahydromethanopterin reductase-like flavin-dependent oxidoreductase (luciferase family)
MKFGIHILPTYMPEVEGPLPDFYRQMFDQIIEVEKLGFDQAWITEHHFGGYGGSLPHPPTFLSAVARRRAFASASRWRCCRCTIHCN